MKITRYVLIAVLAVLLVLAAGCTTQQPETVTQAPVATMEQQQTAPPATAAPTARAPAIDTTINVRFGEINCIDVQEQMGVDYLYPDQKFRLEAASPGANTINANVLLVDKNDEFKLREAEPEWDSVRKTWNYEGVNFVVKFLDVTVPVEKEFTIKDQGKYYLCADDRMDSGSREAVYRVPVKLTKL